MRKVFDWFRRARDEALVNQELNMLSDHLLRDVGVERGQIPRIASAMVRAKYDGAFETGPALDLAKSTFGLVGIKFQEVGRGWVKQDVGRRAIPTGL